MPLVRMGRGKMMGVDHNKGLRFVGAAAGLIALKCEVCHFSRVTSRLCCNQRKGLSKFETPSRSAA